MMAQEGPPIDLRAACSQYYLAQQALQAAERDKVHLEGAAAALENSLSQKREMLIQLRDTKTRLQQQLNTLSRFPPGTTPAQAEHHITQQKTLDTTITLADGALENTLLETERIRKEIAQHARTTLILEESLKSQVKYNEVLHESYGAATKRIKHEQERICAQLARKKQLEEAVAAAQKNRRKVGSAVRTRNEMKSRAQHDVQEYDMDALRLRRDTALARRIYLTELEYAREEELWLQQLLLENKRLKQLAISRGRSPLIEGLKNAPANTAPNTAASRETQRGATVKYKEGGVEALDTVTVHGIDPPSPKKGLVDQYREYNLRLLQQMVGSVNLLHQQLKFGKPTELAAEAAGSAVPPSQE